MTSAEREIENKRKQTEAIPNGYVRVSDDDIIQAGDMTWRIGSEIYLPAGEYIGRKVGDWGHFVIRESSADKPKEVTMKRETEMNRIYERIKKEIARLNELGYYVSDRYSTICIFDARQEDSKGNCVPVKDFQQHAKSEER